MLLFRDVNENRFADEKILARQQQFCRVRISFLDNPPGIGDEVTLRGGFEKLPKMSSLRFHQGPGGGHLVVLLLQFLRGYGQFFKSGGKLLQSLGYQGFFLRREQKPLRDLVKAPAGDFQPLAQIVFVRYRGHFIISTNQDTSKLIIILS